MLFEADKLRQQGRTVLVDSYFDKLIREYLGKPGMEWLMAPSDAYFKAAELVAELDWRCLPNANVVVFFQLDRDTWLQFIDGRGRELDQQEAFRSSFSTQDYLHESAKKFCDEFGARLVVFTQKTSTPHAAATELLGMLTR